MPSDTRPSVTEALALSLTAAMAEIHHRGWCDGTGGNFSCVVERDPLQLLMAPSGVHHGRGAPVDSFPYTPLSQPKILRARVQRVRWCVKTISRIIPHLVMTMDQCYVRTTESY